MADKEMDALTGTETTGHEWDGLKELNSPLPKWWLWTFYATIIWGIGYFIVYPSWPIGLSDYTKGMFGYSSRAELVQHMEMVRLIRPRTLIYMAVLAIVAAVMVFGLARQPGAVSARVNMTTRRLVLAWRPGETGPDDLIGAVSALGYRLVLFDPALIEAEAAKRETELLRAMAVAGFAAGNVMLLSASVWAGHSQGMGPATRDLLHWISALIALPAVAYAGVPFFRSAQAVLRAGRMNMDVPISLAVVLAAAMSLHETAVGAPHAYFDSAVTLLFFLLVGRYLDRRARGRARSAAAHLLALNAGAVTIVEDGGRRRLVPPAQLRPGMTMIGAAGERIGDDGCVVGGTGEVDTQLIDGESVLKPAAEGTPVFAGSLAVSGPLTVEVTAVGEDTLLAEIVRLVEAAEQGRGRYVAIADRVAKLYAPVVHGLALATFAGWLVIAGVTWQQAPLTAIADTPRDDAADVVAALKAGGHRVVLLSGDRAPAASAVAVGIDDRRAGCDPAEKVRRLGDLAAEGRRVLMVGDGLNDAPALAAAHASMSPSTAADVSQTAADVVFQGERLAPILETLGVARRAGALVRQNFALAFGYNTLTIPLAVAGLVTPLVAAAAMSASSVAVISNALRLSRGKVS